MKSSLRSRDQIHFFQNFDLSFIMRVSCIYMIVVLGTASVLSANPSIGQGIDQEVSIGMNNESLRTLFQKIQNTSSLTFLFGTQLVESYESISFPYQARTIRETLEIALSETDLKFEDSGLGYIIISKKNGSESGPLGPGSVGDSWKAVPVSGIVKDKKGEPLPGVNVVVKGSTVGTSTDAKGNFTIDVPQGSETLVFSFIGFKTMEMSLNGRTTFEISLESDVTTLQTVEISGGYYTTTDRMKMGSIVKVDAKEIESQPVTNPLMALQGRVPGLDIVPNSGVPGGAVRVQIRGRNSLRDNSRSEVANSPLYVVDGVPIDPSPIRSGSESETTVFFGYDPLSTISPSNIESIQILKDADATAIYGSRGANGVILIKTKQGTNSGSTGVDVSYYTGIGQLSHQLDLLNTEQYLMMRREALRNDGMQAPAVYEVDINGVWDTTRYTNWQKELLGGTAKIHDVQINLSGGGNNTSFRLGGGYHKEGTIYPGDFGSEMISARLSLNHSSLNGKFRASTSVNFGRTRNRTFESSQFVSQAVTLPPTAPKLYNEDGSLNWQLIPLFGMLRASFDNPVARLLNTSEMVQGSLIADGNFSYSITPNLSLKTNLGFTNLNGDEIIKRPIASQSPTTITGDVTGSATFGSTRRQSWIMEPQIVYNRSFSEHHIDFLIGATWQESESSYLSVFGSGYTSDVLLDGLQAATDQIVLSDDGTEFRYLAFFSRLQYNWKDRYLITATGRRDGSSRFGPGNRWGNFGAIGVAWVFSNENFAHSLPVLSLGKIRFNYGVTGNDQIGDYKFLDIYNISQYRYQGAVTLNPSSLYNPNFSWEETRKMEGAFELGLFSDRVFFELDWYSNRSSNQLINYQLPAVTGFDGVFQNFQAEVENRGIEAILRVVPISKERFQWTTSFNISRNRNELLRFPGLETSSYAAQYRVGEPLSLRNLYTYTGIDPVTGLYTFKDVDGNGYYNSADASLSNPTARSYFGGLTNDFRIGSLTVSFTIQFARQYMAGYVPLSSAGSVNLNVPVAMLARWREEGDVAQYPKYSNTSPAWNSAALFNTSDGNVDNASFLRLKTASIAYVLPSRWFDNTYLAQAKVFIQGQNLFTLSDYSGLDPETQMGLPPLRMVSVGANVRF